MGHGVGSTLEGDICLDDPIDRPDIGHFQWRESWARGNRKITLVTFFKLVHPIRYHNVALPRNVREFQTRHAGIFEI